ncbi:flagellin [Rhodanobacter sp. TND4EL1]
MVMSVNTNISSLNAQHNLAKSQSKLSTAIERLSSGMRINSAKDDAAGLAISTRFTTQINGLNQAVRNANDGISMAQTTESALDEVTNNLQRIRELAVQSANGSNSDTDRAALNKEVQQRLAEVTRISSQTNFNGKHVLNGTAGSTSFQVGANVGESISIDLSQGTRTQDMGKLATAGSGDVSGVFASAGSDAVAEVKGSSTTGTVDKSKLTAGAKITVGATEVTFTDLTGSSDAAAAATAAAGEINTALQASTNGDKNIVATGNADGTITFNQTTGEDGAINVTDTAGALGTPGAATTGVAAKAAVPAQSNLKLDNGEFTLTVGSTTVDMAGSYKDAASLVDAINSKGVQGLSASVDKDGKIQLASQSDMTIGGSKANSTLGFTAGLASAGGSLDNVDISTMNGANETMNRIDAALQTVSDLRSNLGAVQNRFDSTISNLQTISQNLSSSRSQIQDADFASETANMSSANILQQAGVSVLAQANSSTQSVLKLLQ